MKVILFVSFISIISQISSISPPKFPVTFHTHVKVVVQNGNVIHNPITESLANDDAKELFVMNEKYLPDTEVKSLFNNNHLYAYDGINCACLNVSYKGMNLPFFSPYKNFVKYTETDSDVIWKWTGAPHNEKYLFVVKKATPNVPEKMVIMYPATGNPEFTRNITFIGFQASQPESGFFTIPDDCTKIPCQSSPKNPSVFFSKFLRDPVLFNSSVLFMN